MAPLCSGRSFPRPSSGFDADVRPVYEADGSAGDRPGPDGVDTVRDVGLHEVAARHPGVPVEHLSGRLIALALSTCTCTFPQVDVIGSPASGLLPWLENYTFPQESRFADPATRASGRVLPRPAAAHGVTTALTFATSHPRSVDALLRQARRRRVCA